MSDDAKYIPVGNGTEVGLLRFLQESNYEIQDLLTVRQRQGILETNIPFSSIRKRQLVAIRPHANAEYVRVVIKGAPEVVLPMCKSQLNQRGEEVNLSNDERDHLLNQEIINGFCRKGYRSIVYGYSDIKVFDWEILEKQHNNFQSENDRQVLEKDFTFVVAFALNDDLRQGVRESILKLKDG
jgi:magnesium-transporting ATPase (P-type)